MNKRLYRNKKGVSSVIGTILMILVVMVGMSVLFSALIVYSDNFQSGRGSSVLEDITVEDVFFNPPEHPGAVQLTIYNTGKVELTITNVYVDGRMVSISPEKFTLAQGAHEDKNRNVLIVTGMTFEIGKAYNFKIVTDRGTGFEGTYAW